MTEGSLLFQTFVFLSAACLVVPLASRFRLGSVLGYLLAGIMIGPFGLGLIRNSNEIMHFAEFGVVMMLFLIGLELEPYRLWKMRKTIVGLGGLQVTITTLLLSGIGMALGFSWQASLACAMALSLSSTALVLQMLQEKGLLQTEGGEYSFSVLLFQDIAVIPILIIMPLLAINSSAPVIDHQQSTWISSLNSYQHALVILCVISAVIVAGQYLSRYIFRYIAKTNLREVFTATSLALIVGITLLMKFVGVSPALGAFIAGLVLANSEYKHTLETDIEPFKGLLLGLFFISVGMGMNFLLLGEQTSAILGAVGALIFIKLLILLFLGRLFGLTFAQNTLFACAISQGGEFAFVLFQFAGSLDVIAKDQAAFLMLTVALSMAVTPFLMMLNERFILSRCVSILPEYDKIVDVDNPVIIAGYGRFGQIIGRFMHAQGIKTTILEKDPDQIEQIRRFGNKAYFGDASKIDLLRSAGIEKAKMLVIAIDDPDKALEMVYLVKEHFPKVKILARARNRRHAYNLHKAGVDYYRRETFDSALKMAQFAMEVMGKSPSEVRFKAKQFRRHDEKTLRHSFAFFEKEPELISFSKQVSSELERILQSDITEDPK
ncbi:MAG: cation:proton antiporter [Proteobacteria bacterium]|nr:cation:proton antiporter [Pseudomonadota bacterium]